LIQYLASNLKVLSAEVALPDSGVASYKEMVEFVQTTINEKTDVHDGTTSKILAEAIVQSILNRLRVGFLWR
jgi:hypothetical protein